MKRKMGIIGYGNMGSWHAENVNKRIENLEVVAVYDIDPERSALAEKNRLIAYSSAEELLKSGIDLVLVSTPNNLHKDYCILAMNMGIDVVCEKPACIGNEELEEVIAVSKRTGKLFTVHQNRRFDCDFVAMKEIINREMLGKLYFLDSRLYSNRGCSNKWRTTQQNGGGALFDWGIHMIDQVLCLINSEPEFVFAELQNVHYPEVDDVCHILIGFENGVRAQIVIDFWCHIDEPRWHLSGEEGTASIEKWFTTTGKIIRAKTKEVNWEDGCVYTPNGLSKTMWPRPKQEIEELEMPTPEKEPRWEEFYENVLDVLDGKAKPIVTHKQLRRSMKVMMAAFESSKLKNTVIL